MGEPCRRVKTECRNNQCFQEKRDDDMEEWLENTLSEGLRRDLAAWRGQYPWEGTRALPSPVYRYHGREIFEAAVAALLAGEHLLLVGPKATGKNVLAENLAAAFGRPM